MGAADKIKLMIAGLMVIAGLVGFYYFDAQFSSNIRGFALVGVLIAAVAVASQTALGRNTVTFIGESRFELRKVVWPTRAETIRTTVVIIIVVIIISLLMGLIDLILKWAIMDNLLQWGR